MRTTVAQVEHYQKVLTEIAPVSPGKIDGILGPKTYASLESVNVRLFARHDLPKPKYFSLPRSRRTVDVTILHWPGGKFDAKYWAKYFATHNSPQKQSIHWVVDETGAYQLLQHEYVSNHTAGHNTHSIGVEICQYPFFDDKGKEDAKRRSLVITQCETHPRRSTEAPYATLDPRIEQNVVTLCKLLGYPTTDHASFTKGKIDVIPWKAAVLGKL